MYTDLITEEAHTNVQFQQSNTTSKNRLKNFGEYIENTVRGVKVLGPLYDFSTNFADKGQTVIQGIQNFIDNNVGGEGRDT